MTQWEYKIEFASIDTHGQSVHDGRVVPFEVLEAWGLNGWELVTVVAGINWEKLFFKRPLHRDER